MLLGLVGVWETVLRAEGEAGAKALKSGDLPKANEAGSELGRRYLCYCPHGTRSPVTPSHTHPSTGATVSLPSTPP